MVEAQKLCHKLDKDGSSGVSFDEFAAYYEKKLMQEKRSVAAHKRKEEAAAAAGNWACNPDISSKRKAAEQRRIDRLKVVQN